MFLDHWDMSCDTILSFRRSDGRGVAVSCFLSVPKIDGGHIDLQCHNTCSQVLCAEAMLVLSHQNCLRTQSSGLSYVSGCTASKLRLFLVKSFINIMSMLLLIHSYLWLLSRNYIVQNFDTPCIWYLYEDLLHRKLSRIFALILEI